MKPDDLRSPDYEAMLSTFEAAAAKRLRDAGLPDTLAELSKTEKTEADGWVMTQTAGHAIESGYEYPTGVLRAYEILQRCDWAREHLQSGDYERALSNIARLWQLATTIIAIEDGPYFKRGKAVSKASAAGAEAMQRRAEKPRTKAIRLAEELRKKYPTLSDTDIANRISPEVGRKPRTVRGYIR